jgi:predicted CoA-binding protein
MGCDHAQLRAALNDVRSIATVGLPARFETPCYGVTLYL